MNNVNHKIIDADIFKNYIMYGYLKDKNKKMFSINDILEMIDRQPEIDINEIYNKIYNEVK